MANRPSLQSELKRLAGSSAVYGIGSLLQRAVGVLLLPFLSHALAPEEFGIAALLTLVTVAATGLFNLGIAHSLPIFYFAEVDADARPRIIWSALALVTISSAVSVLALTIVAPSLSQLIFQTPTHANLLCLAILALAVSTITEPMLCHLRMEHRPRAYVLLTLSGTLIHSTLALTFVFGLGWGVEGLLIAALTSAVCVLAMAAVVTLRRLTFGFDRALLIPLARLGLPPAVGLLAYLVIDYADRSLIQRMAGLDQVGIYAIGCTFGMGMLALVNAFASAWTPFSMSFIHRRNEGAALFAKTLKYYVIGFGLVCVLAFGLAKPTIDLIVASDYRQAHIVVGMIAAAYMLKGCYLIMLPALNFERKLGTQAVLEWTAALSNIALCAALLPTLGIAGAALATLLSYALLAALAFGASRRHLCVPYDWNRLMRAGVIIAAACAFELWGSLHWSAVQSLTVALLTFTAAGLLLFMAVLTPAERTRMGQLLDLCPRLARMRVPGFLTRTAHAGTPREL